jgi:[ribosomal protein S5]-alanine N-acetyltransferase
MLDINFSPFTELTTDRLLLRRTTEADLQALFEMRSNPDVMRYLARPLAQTMDDVKGVFQMIDDRINQNEGINWAISWKNEPSVYIGVVGLFRIDKANHRAEIGYMLAPQYWGQNIMSELIPAILDYGFETLKCHSIEAVIAPENGASRRVLEKNGFVVEAYFKENVFFEGKYLDSMILSILNPKSE